MPILLANNNAVATLAAPISNTAVQIPLASGSGALFPSPANGQYFAVTLNDQATGAVYEYCYCVQRTGDVLTVTRGQEGSVALNWLAGDIAVCNMTAGQLEQMAQVFYFSGSNPNGSVAGTTGVAPIGSIQGYPPSFCWAATGGASGTGALWGCTQTGPAASALWSLFAGPYTDSFGGTDSIGYRIASDGFIEQWGTVNDNTHTAQSVVFPIVFPNARLGITCQKRIDVIGDYAVSVIVGIGATSPFNDYPNPLQGFNWYGWSSGGASQQTQGIATPGHFTWRAWGY